MRINEAARLTGMTKKNIRFYEEQGLLLPNRNRENGYRDYSDGDLELLRRIKLFRKLGLPIEEIKSLQSGKSTVSDIMKRHLILLEREQANLAHAHEICRVLAEKDIRPEQLDSAELLEQMSRLESAGASFNDANAKDVKSAIYKGAVIASAAIIAFMTAIFLFIIWAVKDAPEEAPPLPFVLLILAVPVAVSVGVCASLIQRIGEIRKGEFLDAKRF